MSVPKRARGTEHDEECLETISKYMNAMTVCCAAVLALSLAGCISSGGGGGATANATRESSGGGGVATTVDPSTVRKPVTVDSRLLAKAIGERTPVSPTTADAPFSMAGYEFAENPQTRDDTDDDFTKSEDRSVAMIEGWDGSVYTRSESDGKVVMTVVTYTDFEPPADQAYSEYYSVDEASERDAVLFADADGVLTFDNNDLVGNHMLFAVDLSDIVIPGMTHRFEDDTNTMGVDESVVSRQGRFNDILGTFACTVNCELTFDADGNVSGANGEWTFTPDDKAVVMKGVVRDAEYMNLAYWLKSTEADDGTIIYVVGTLAHGNPIGGYGSTDSVTGSAKYAGPATGLYRKTFASHGTSAPGAAGQFTANAELTAYFGQTDDQSIEPNLLNTISGVVKAFKDSAGNPISDAWTLRLDKTNIQTRQGTFEGTTTGTGDEGTWRGQFEGDETKEAIPSATTVVFHGHFSDGHVAGAFGARKE